MQRSGSSLGRSAGHAGGLRVGHSSAQRCSLVCLACAVVDRSFGGGGLVVLTGFAHMRMKQHISVRSAVIWMVAASMQYSGALQKFSSPVAPFSRHMSGLLAMFGRCFIRTSSMFIQLGCSQCPRLRTG